MGDQTMEDDKISNVLNTNINVAIIQISSRGATFRATDPLDSVYCSSKFGVRGFSDVLFKEVKNLGIKVCQLMPGWVNTELAHKYADKLIFGKYDSIKRHII